jgi:hypothetical protein
MENRIKLMKFDEELKVMTKEKDFSYSIFMVLPFPNMTSFKYQQTLIELIVKKEQFVNESSSKIYI